MAERSVVVRLRAEIADFKRQMAEATKATKSVGDETDKTAKKADTALGQLVQSAAKNEAAWTRTGVALLGFGTVLAAGVGVSIAKFAEFDQAMSEVRASTHETAANMDLLRGAAIQAGADTQFSATEAAHAIDEMAKAGVSTADILSGGLAGAMSLAAAGGLDVARAAEIAATAMTQFRLSGSDIPHIADLLAAGAGKAQGSVDDLAGALKYAGVPAGQLGLSIEETTGTLALFASNGVLGEQAGTSFRAMLMSMTAPSKIAERAMAEYNVTLFDANGEFVGMAAAAEQLKSKLGPLTEAERQSALGRIFGNESMSAALALYDAGAKGVQEWTAAVNDQGYAAITAATKMDNLRGDLEMLSGSVDTALIQTGSAGNEVLRHMVQQLTGVVDAYGQLPEPVQRATLQFGALAAGGALLGGALLTTVPKALELRKSINDLADSSPKAAAGLKAVGKAAGALAIVAVAGAAVSSFTDETNKSVLSLAEATKFLASSSVNLEKVNQQFAELQTKNGSDAGFKSLEDGLRNLANPGVLDRLNDVSASILGIVGFPYENGRPEREALIEQLGSMGDGLAQLAQNGQADLAAEQFDVFAAAAQAAGISQAELLDMMPAYRDALAENETQGKLAAEEQVGLGDAFDQTSGQIAGVTLSAEDAADAISAFSDELDRILGATFSVEEAQDRWQEGLNDLAEAAKKNGLALSGTTDKAIANRDAMREQVTMGFDVIRTMAEQGAGSEELKAKTADLKAEFIRQADAAGYNKDEVALLAAAFDEIPGRVESVVDVATEAASAKLAAFQAKINGLTGKTVYIDGVERIVKNVDRIAADGAIFAFADGGGLPAIGAQQPQIQPNRGPGGIMWAETGAGPWEAFISGHPAKHDRSVAIWEETGEKLGINFARFADGGYYGAASASTASSGPTGPVVARLSTTDMWELARAVSQVTLSLNGRAVSEQMGQSMTRAGVR